MRKLKEEHANTKVRFLSNVLNVEELVTLPLNVPIKEIQIVMMKIASRKTRGIKRTRKETMEGMTRTPHLQHSISIFSIIYLTLH